MLSLIHKTTLIKMIAALSAITESHGIAMTPNQRIDLTFSKEGITRITVENDGIDDLFVYPKKFGDNIQKSANGHLFVVGEGIDESVSLSIITKRNIAQDLRLTPCSKKAEPIILTYIDPEADKKEEQKKISKFLHMFLQGQTPSGFMKGNVQETSRSRGSIEAVSVSSYRNHQYVITEFTVKNIGKDKETLNPANLWSEGDLAVVFNVESLDSSLVGKSDEAKMFVIRKS